MGHKEPWKFAIGRCGDWGPDRHGKGKGKGPHHSGPPPVGRTAALADPHWPNDGGKGVYIMAWHFVQEATFNQAWILRVPPSFSTMNTVFKVPPHFLPPRGGTGLSLFELAQENSALNCALEIKAGLGYSRKYNHRVRSPPCCPPRSSISTAPRPTQRLSRRVPMKKVLTFFDGVNRY